MKCNDHLAFQCAIDNWGLIIAGFVSPYGIEPVTSLNDQYMSVILSCFKSVPFFPLAICEFSHHDCAVNKQVEGSVKLNQRS